MTLLAEPPATGPATTLDTPDPAQDAVFEQLAQVGKAFANPKRLQLLNLLTQGERTVDALARTAGLGVTTVSSHLQVLKLAGLVTTRRDGNHVYYRVAGDDVAALLVDLRTVATEHSAALAAAVAAFFGGHGDERVAMVGRDELLDLVRRGAAVVIDVRPAEEFAAGHIAGAASIPLADLRDQLDRLPTDVEIVAYCRGPHCVMADDAVRLLAAHQRRARRLDDGVVEWSVAGLPTEAGT